jgi:hypothetical protein
MLQEFYDAVKRINREWLKICLAQNQPYWRPIHWRIVRFVVNKDSAA